MSESKMSESKTSFIRHYDKIPEYIESVLNIFKIIYKKSIEQKDNKLKMISHTIYNYITFMAKTHNINIKDDIEIEIINMIPIFEYISYNNIELYDFFKINITDLDVNKKEDLERFVLTHIYYITQSNK
jgi:hypothetical protein